MALRFSSFGSKAQHKPHACPRNYNPVKGPGTRHSGIWASRDFGELCTGQASRRVRLFGFRDSEEVPHFPYSLEEQQRIHMKEAADTAHRLDVSQVR